MSSFLHTTGLLQVLVEHVIQLLLCLRHLEELSFNVQERWLQNNIIISPTAVTNVLHTAARKQRLKPLKLWQECTIEY